ncbi:MAG: hypothetical protein Q8Q09_18105 [Deltaproteobacteria bacterium]|nr:hypothetical protein [Deltaproteobacteria bacterium]
MTKRDAEDFLSLSRPALREMLCKGHPIEPGDVAGMSYRGVSLGLPPFAVKLSWLTFRKTFYKPDPDAPLRGWNVRMKQNGLRGPAEPMRDRSDNPRCFGHYRVIHGADQRMPLPAQQGLLIVYEPLALARDPLVALDKGSSEWLLGMTFVALGPLQIVTPSYFVLQREGPIDYVPLAERDRASSG